MNILGYSKILRRLYSMQHANIWSRCILQDFFFFNQSLKNLLHRYLTNCTFQSTAFCYSMQAQQSDHKRLGLISSSSGLLEKEKKNQLFEAKDNSCYCGNSCRFQNKDLQQGKKGIYVRTNASQQGFWVMKMYLATHLCERKHSVLDIFITVTNTFPPIQKPI